MTSTRKKMALIALAFAGTLAAGASQARDNVAWSVSIGGPVVGATIGSPVYSRPYYPVYSQPVYAQPVYAQPVYASPYYVPAPVVVRRGYRVGWDRDHDGIPNRYDRVYNPRWDRDGDGIPNSHDRHPGRRG